MKVPIRLSALFFVGVLIAGSTALGFYYYYVYSPPLEAAELFLDAMESGDGNALERSILISVGPESENLRSATTNEIASLLAQPFERGRVLDQRSLEGRSQSYHYLVYREPDGRIYALVVTEFDGRYSVVIPESPMSERRTYLWDYTWTN